MANNTRRVFHCPGIRKPHFPRFIHLFLSLILCFALLLEYAGAEETAEPQLTKDLVILFTGDVHCGVDENWGTAGLYEVKRYYEQDNHVMLVDDGDAIQGAAIGTFTYGHAVLQQMNLVKYDLAIPGNHEFDYGMDNFMKIVSEAEFPYICCNLFREGQLVLAPSLIREFDGVKIGFVGVTTPTTIRSTNPKTFLNEEGEFVYSFLQQDETGEALYSAIQQTVDDVRAQGAKYVILVGHLGNNSEDSPWSYSDVISHTNGIDVLLDGHSHDYDKVVMKNKDGRDVLRAASGTKLNSIGVLTITTDGKIDSTLLDWDRNYPADAASLLNLDNPVVEDLLLTKIALYAVLDEVVAQSAVDLTIDDPILVDENGQPVRIIRQAETNLGDLCADAFRYQTGAEIGVVNGGGIRVGIEAGDITYGEILSVFPFGNALSMVRVTGQQILDALEWGVHSQPNEFGGFLHVSGLTFEFDPTVDSPAHEDSNLLCIPIDKDAPRRVRSVMVGDKPLDPDQTYTLAGAEYVLLDHGGGHTAFDGCEVLQKEIMLDNEALIGYIAETLGGVVGEEYENPYGQGRIVSVTAEE